MKRTILALTASALLLSVAPAPIPASQLFQAGETLRFDLTWLHVSGGSLDLSIAPLAGDHARYRIASLARTSSTFAKIYKVRDEIESVVARTTFSTTRYHKHLEERGRTKDDDTTVDEARHIASRKRDNVIEFEVPSPVFDPLSIIYHLRTLDLKPGTTHQLRVLADGKVYSLSAAVEGRESLETDAGTFETVRVVPSMAGGGIFRDDGENQLTIWYTDDERHIPIRIQSEVKVGTIVATLKRLPEYGQEAGFHSK